MKELVLVLSLSLALFSCKKEVDHPPITVLEDNQIITLDTLLALYKGENIEFDKDVSVFATVTMDEVDGNVYKNLFIQDGNSAINMRLESSGDLFVGDYIRINLNGTLLSKFAGVMQLDQVDFDKNIAIQKSNAPLTPQIVTIEELSASFLTTLATEPNDESYQWLYGSKLVKLKNVQFSAGDLNGTYADGPAQQSKNINLTDCTGNAILVRSSGFANFANDTVPTLNGDITLIVSRYNSDLQLTIRSITEVNFTEERCEGIALSSGETLTKNFNDDEVTSGGWITSSVIGSSVQWETTDLGGAASPYLKIQNWDGTANNVCENWFISPSIGFESSSSPTLSFGNDVNYQGAPLRLLVSTDFIGYGNPNDASWIDITASVTWDPNTSAWGFANTGDIDFSQFAGQSIFIGFKYTGSATNGSTWELDDIIITG